VPAGGEFYCQRVPSTLDVAKADLIDKAAELARQRKSAGGPPAAQVGALLACYYRHVSAEDVCDRGETDVYGALASHYKTAGDRPQGTTKVRVFTPGVAEQGWSAAGHSVVEIVTDDMPFLVDTVAMALASLEHTLHLIIHPQFDVERDVAGQLRAVKVPEDGHTATAAGGSEWVRESWMHVEIDRVGSHADIVELELALDRALRDVRDAVDDWPRLQTRLLDIVAELRSAPPPGVPTNEIEHSVEFLEWLADEHFVFLGYREYHLVGEGAALALPAVPGTGLGILRSDPDQAGTFEKLPALVRAKAKEKAILVLAKANSKSTVHRPSYLDYVGVKKFDADGNVVGERRFLGLFSSATYTESVTRIPLLRNKVAEVLQRVGFDDFSHAGKSLLNVLENYPRDELFYSTAAELVPIAEAVMVTRERRQLRLFTRRDTYGRYVSCLVYLPQDRYNTGVREKLAAILQDSLGAESVEFSVRMNESLMAQVHFVARPPRGRLIPDFDILELERKLAEAARSWKDDFATAVLAELGEESGSRLARRYLNSFPEAYKEDFSAATGAVDLVRLEAISGQEGLSLSMYEEIDCARGESRVKVYRVGEPISLSRMLPMLTSMGVEVVDERPYELDHLPRTSYIYDFGLRYPAAYPDQARVLFQEALQAVWDGHNETDGFNALVLAAGLNWRQVTVLRAYAKYMKQGSTPFALDYIHEALRANVDITRLLVTLFECRFDPAGIDAERAERAGLIEAKILRALDDVASLDHDRILRSYLAHIRGTLRTNYFQRPVGAQAHRASLSFKLEPATLPDLPQPRPAYEIFVYSPRVEGVHLRFGAVARGGLRWSDRRDDFRTEVLGLVKAQMVKNTVIVPVGAKGGFFCKQLPDPGDREGWLAEGIACYSLFISALLDITDNLVDGQVVPPAGVVRHDGDDPYLVVAADKGTATFSDIANRISQEHGFWLGDAFASGGSVGYDHKAMGITARGAWVSVQRHFREMGVDCQREDFTCVGIGDMSGDVFGNGLLCSEHTQLVAAFDHRDIFIDPVPDPATSYAERARLFALPRSSWQDYDKTLISPGGGVFSRSAKAISLTTEMIAALGLEVVAGAGTPSGAATMTPAELMKAILQAPVDLLWNGGIGTYVKATDETDAEAGDKANDAIRINGAQLRARCVGEGGNLGFTQRGRIEYAVAGGRVDGAAAGRINTDFIDNSAGVDTSDHEVNIKILLDRVVAAGDLTGKQRNQLLASMTEEVGGLVLRDNYEQNLALANAAANASDLLHVHGEMITQLERDGVFDRELEALPSAKEIRSRLERGEGLTVPELSVLLAWTKIVLAQELLASGLPDDPFLHADLIAYFPSQMHEQYQAEMLAHPLKREIIVTQVVNDLVNGAGITFCTRLAGETGASTAELTTANFVAREIFGSLAWRDELKTWDNRLDATVQTRMRIEMRTLVERASRWLVTRRRGPLDSAAVAASFTGPVQETLAQLPDLMVGRELAAYVGRRDRLINRGAPPDLAARAAVLSPAYMLLGIVETAVRHSLPTAEVASVHFALGERLGLPDVLGRIIALPREDRWQTMARAALREELYDVHGQLTDQVLVVGEDGAQADDQIERWAQGHGDLVARAVATLAEVCSDEKAELARMSVALRVVRGLLATT
jgi:glutamate dehydrogenase